MTMLGDVAAITDCEHKTAPACEDGSRFAWSIGTKAIRNGTIQYDQARPVDEETYAVFSRRRAPAHGDLILAREAPVGGAVLVPEHWPVCLGQRTVLVSPAPKKLDHRYLFYALRSPETQTWMRVHSEGSTVKHLNVRDIYRIPLGALPDIREQHRIARVLGAFDDLIETNRRLADQLDALRRTRVSAALAASSVTTSLNEVASFVNGRNFTNGADGTGRPVIRTPEVRSGPGGNTVWSSVAVADEGRIARVGDILFVWSGSLMVNRWIYTDGLVNQHVFKVIPNQVPDWYVFALIEAQLPWFVSLANDKATTMGHIQRANLDVPMTGLDPDTIGRLGPAIEPIWSAALELRLEAQELARQRDELLPLLMSGRVRVSEVEGVA